MYQLKLAKLVSQAAHKNQKYGDKDYFYHCEQVANLLSDDLDKTIAYLHDILEDTDISEFELGNWFGGYITSVIKILTRNKDEKYFDYIKRISMVDHATRIKIADLTVNLQNQTNQSLKERYEKALNILKNKSI